MANIRLLQVSSWYTWSYLVSIRSRIWRMAYN